MPTGSGEAGPEALCLICGQRGLADAILNALLFMPLGAGLAHNGWPARRTLLIGGLLSVGIELAQSAIPGRHAAAGDVLYNTIGAVIGFQLLRSAAVWLRPEPHLARVLASVWLMGLLGVVWLTGYLLQPSYPDSSYFGQWTPRLGHLAWYRGKVLEFRIGPALIPPRRLVNSREVRRLLDEKAPLKVRAVSGPRTDGLGSLVSIYDDRQREVILLGPDGETLVLRLRTRGAGWRFDQPDLRFQDALAGLAPGDTFDVIVESSGDGYFLRLDGVSSCELKFTLGMGWALLYYLALLPVWGGALLNFAWLAGLSAPGAYWSYSRLAAWIYPAAVLTGLTVFPAMTGLGSTTILEYVGVAAGVTLGAGVRRAVWRRPGSRASNLQAARKAGQEGS